MPDLDIAANRKERNFSRKAMAARMLWELGRWVFRLSPRIAFGYRNAILRLFGAKIGRNVHIYASAVITIPWHFSIGDDSSIGEHALIYTMGRVDIGKRATISQRTHLCAGAHDYTLPSFPLLKSPIVIGDNAWVCADAFIGPGVTIGDGAVIGACAVLTKDAPPWKIMAGNPAKIIKDREIKES